MRHVFLLVALAATTALLPAQTFRGEIKGTVEDGSGAVLPGTTVSVLHKATGVGRSTVSGSNGDFSFPDLPTGVYTVTVTKPGFQEQKSDVEVVVSRVASVNFKLPVASQSSVVEVSAAVASIE